MYKLTKGTLIIRLSDGVYVPNDAENRDYQEYLEWVGGGNSPEPAMTEQEEQLEIVESLSNAVDSFMDSKAQEKGFRDRHSYALRAGIPGSSWHQGALTFGAWMDSVNDYCYKVLEDCKAGRRTIPSVSDLLAELPTYPLGEN